MTTQNKLKEMWDESPPIATKWYEPKFYERIDEKIRVLKSVIDFDIDIYPILTELDNTIALDTVFEDFFGENKLDEKKWSTMGYWAKKLLGENFPQPGDLQHLSSGNNLLTGKKGLVVQARKEKAAGSAECYSAVVNNLQITL